MLLSTKNGGDGAVWLCWTLALAVSGVAMCAGCRGQSKPKTVPVRGKVTYQGEPVSQGRVSFMPVQPAEGYPKSPASGTINSDGTFELSTYGENDGAVPGKYQVAIISMTGGPTPEDPDAQEEWHIPQKYGSTEQSGLDATVSADATAPIQLDFNLED